MALTITRPQGTRFSNVLNTAFVDNSFNYAQFTKTAHGLSDGQKILIRNSPVPAYNGHWYVSTGDANTFFLRAAPTSDFIAWVTDTTLQYQAADATNMMWVAVHNPIVYDVVTDMFPTPQDSNLTISAITNNNGYTRLQLSGSLSAVPLEYLQIKGADSERLNGIWEIQLVESSNRYTIDLVYDAGDVTTGAQVNNYYNNFAIEVQVFAGIMSGSLAYKKPPELAATLKYIPDSNNSVRFSISEVLKAYVANRNTLDDGLPANWEFYTDFYCTYQETYDEVFSGVIERQRGDLTSDEGDYVGTAVNAMLPFKNIYGGFLSDYIMNISTAKFLTLFALPVLFGCQENDEQCYQDISFISPDGGGTLQRTYYRNGVLQQTIEEPINERGHGVYRMPLRYPGVNECAYDEIGLTLIGVVDLDVDTFTNYGTGQNWTTGPTVTLPTFLGQPTSSKDGAIAYFVPAGTSFNVKVSVDISGVDVGGGGSVQVIVRALKSNGTAILGAGNSATYTTSLNGTSIPTLALSPTEDVYFIALKILVTYTDGGSHSTTVDWNYMELPNFPVSELKKFRVDCGCANQEIMLTWMNNLGGFDYWAFRGEQDTVVDVVDAGEQTKNLLPDWPKSYDNRAQTIRSTTYRDTREQIVVRTQYLTLDELNAISYIKSSPLVQRIEGSDLRTYTVDTNSFTKTMGNNKLYELQFTITATDDIPSPTT